MRTLAFSRPLLTGAFFLLSVGTFGTPANKSALARHYDRFLPATLSRCTTCHLPSPNKNPENLDEFPHNAFGKRLRELGESGGTRSIVKRLDTIAGEDSDRDGFANEVELLLGSNPGDAKDIPSEEARGRLVGLQRDLKKFFSAYRWQPFEPVRRPPAPALQNDSWVRNELDRFVASEHETRGLTPRPNAEKEVLLRRVYVDLVGVSPSPEERRRFLADSSPNAYERLVDRLLEDPRYGERWGRHWMDIWRYSDWAGWSGGNQIRDSKPHIWRWRDWIVESLNNDKPYSQMIVEMLAADELAPEDTNALRATGFLVRNYKMLSREQWLEDTVKHTSQAFLGVTIGCAKCHDHMTDPISQIDYYRLRAVFEPHQVRTDKLPGELDTTKLGLVRTYDVYPNPPTYFFVRGDERRADTNRVLKPGVPKAFCWDGSDGTLQASPIGLPKSASEPDRREFVVRQTVALAEAALQRADSELQQAGEGTESEKLRAAELKRAAAENKLEGLRVVLRLEELDAAGGKDSPEWQTLAASAAALQKKARLIEAKLRVQEARVAERSAKDIGKATQTRKASETELAEAEKEFANRRGREYKPREKESFPDQTSGRRLAFAHWLTDERNPLTARVAVNHIWLRHFGRGLVNTPDNFGANGNPPSNPQLLDWLATEFVARGWSMKALHRLILTSSTYRMASTTDANNYRIDPDDIYLWRMPSRRLDAELVRDNLLAAAGDLDATMGGPEIDHTAGLTSRRRSIYLQIAAEKEVEFLKIFDGPAVTECYQRHATIMPQQALALANSRIALAEAQSLAGKLASFADESTFVRQAYERILAREPSPEEAGACAEFLTKQKDMRRARENLVLVLFNHNDFVTVR